MTWYWRKVDAASQNDTNFRFFMLGHGIAVGLVSAAAAALVVPQRGGVIVGAGCGGMAAGILAGMLIAPIGTWRRQRNHQSVSTSAITFGLVAWTLGLILALTGLLLTVPLVRSASAIKHPVRATAIAAEAHDPCTRCNTVADASFYDAIGALHTVRLRAPSQDLSYYKPGIALVYDAQKPTSVMAQHDYSDGGSRAVIVVLIVSILLTVGEVVAAIGYIRKVRRRRRTA